MSEQTEQDKTKNNVALAGQAERCVMRRYILHPGYVFSKNDNDRHFIGGPRLARLYGVDIRECVFGDMPGYREQEGDIHLIPRYDGDYTLPYNDEVTGRASAACEGPR